MTLTLDDNVPKLFFTAVKSIRLILYLTATSLPLFKRTANYRLGWKGFPQKKL